jgi:hypothetical protein
MSISYAYVIPSNEIINRSYYLSYAGKYLYFKNAKHDSSLPINSNYVSAKIIRIVRFTYANVPFAFVFIAENYGGNGTFYEMIPLVSANGNIIELKPLRLGINNDLGKLYETKDHDIFLNLKVVGAGDCEANPTHKVIIEINILTNSQHPKNTNVYYTVYYAQPGSEWGN